MNAGVANVYLMRTSGALVIAATAFVPIIMSPVSIRAHDFAKLLALVPIALFAMIAAVIAVGWRAVLGVGLQDRLVSLGMLIFLAIALATSLFADSPAVAFFGRLYRPEGFAAWSAFAAMFLAIRCWIRWTGRCKEFADSLLLVSAIPAAYAVQQSLGYDFYVTPGSEFRATSTMGSPGLLGAYLSICFVVTIARAYSVWHRPHQGISWVGLACLQGWAIWLTRARGPILAALIGVLLLATLFAIRRRSRGGLGAVIAAMIASVSLVASINVAGPLKEWAQTIPGLNRIVFDMSRDASLVTSLSSRSVVSRLGIWQAGMDVFGDAPWTQKTFGFGPESAQSSYFSHIPAIVMRAEDYRTVEDFDRLHADVLDMVLNFGLSGWFLYLVFFSGAVYVASQRIFGSASAGSVMSYAVLVVVLPAVVAGVALAIGPAGLAAPAIGLGVAATWGLHLTICAIRASKCDNDTDTQNQSNLIINVGLVTGLIVYWIDAQINFPLLSAHLLAFSIAALVFSQPSSEASDREYRNLANSRIDNLWVLDLVIGLTMIASIASFLSPVGRASDDSLGGFVARLVVPAIFILGASLVRYFSESGSDRHLARWLGLVLVAPAIYLCMHLVTRPSLASGFEIGFVDRIAAVRLLAIGAAIIVSVVAGLWIRNWAAVVPATRRNRVSIGDAGLAAGLFSVCALFGFMAWRALLGDVAAGSPHLVEASDRYTVDELAEIAVVEAPWEWRHHSDLIYRRLGHALANLKPDGVSADKASEFMRELGKAELAARAAAKAFAHEPWATLALAKVLQVRGLGVLRSLMPETGPGAVQEANALFEIAHRMFPAEPLVLHGWAQLHFDNGALAEGYRLLDKMEAIVPGEPEPYFERAAAAIRTGDVAVLVATVDRARGALPQKEFQRLKDFISTRRTGN